MQPKITHVSEVEAHIDHSDDPSPVIWEREEGTFVWQGILTSTEWLTRIGELGIDDGHDVIYQSGGVWTKIFDHQGRNHLLRWDPNFMVPTFLYCVMCGARDIPPRRETQMDIQRYDAPYSYLRNAKKHAYNTKNELDGAIDLNFDEPLATTLQELGLRADQLHNDLESLYEEVRTGSLEKKESPEDTPEADGTTEA